MESNDIGGTGLDPVMEVLIAQLRRNGTLSNSDIANMKRRLIEGGNPDLAEAITWLLFSDAIDDPELRRASIHSLDGGNGTD